MNKHPRIYLSPPHLGSAELQLVNEAFESNWIAPLGPHVDAFENEMADYLGAGHAAALSSGTAGLHLALRILGIQDGDHVLCSSLTFASSVNVVLYERAIPVFVDADPLTWCIDPLALERALEKYGKGSKKPKALIAVDLYGQSVDHDRIHDLCEKYGIYLIEDAAEALGATYKGAKCGTFGEMAVLSFNGNKIITTSGGGMLISDNEDYITQARFLATQARDKALHYEHSQLGFNYRLSNILAAIGRGQLKVLDERVASRQRVFRHYHDVLSSIEGISFMPEASYGMPTRWLTALTVKEDKTGVSRTDIIQKLTENNIEARPVWKPMHLQPLYRKYDYFTASDGQNISDRLFAEGLILPSGSNLKPVEQDRIIDIVLSLF